ncbi:MAG: tetratricopeptide repeat protein, partial [Acidobacteria bacterium]|nr:tetratricopeptide repeat protein [Acidobacteriota bacterium]
GAELRERALAIQGEPPVLGKLFGTLGLIYHRQGKYAESEELYQKGLRILEKCGPASDLERAMLLNNIAVLGMDTGQREDALPYLNQALLIYEVSPTPRQMAASLFNLGAVYCAVRRWGEAESLLKR